MFKVLQKNIFKHYYQLFKIQIEKMTELKLMQLRHEINTWKRMLSFMQEENVHLKNRLSDVLKDRFNKNLLDEVEFFQTNFIKEDEVIGLLKSEVAAIDNILKWDLITHENNLLIKKGIENVRNNIDAAEKDFTKISIDFNKYLSENI